MNAASKYAPYIPSVIVSCVCVAFYVFRIRFLLCPHSDMATHALYSFSHANIFHLALNLVALFRFKPRWKTCAIAYAVAFVGSYLPFVCMPGATCGLSGFLMACFARYYYAWRKSVWTLLFANLIFIFIPCVNWVIHMVCFILSYFVYVCIQQKRVRC